MQFLCYPGCTTCKKAEKWLEERKIPAEKRNIKEANPTEAEQFRLLASDGMLVRRPILVGEGFVLVGFREDEWEKALG